MRQHYGPSGLGSHLVWFPSGLDPQISGFPSVLGSQLVCIPISFGFISGIWVVFVRFGLCLSSLGYVCVAWVSVEMLDFVC